MKIHVRWQIRRDMVEVLEIDRRSFPLEEQWEEEDFLKCLRKTNCIGMVAEANGKVVGYMIYELHSQRLDLTRMAVSPDLRREGIATRMMDKITGKLHSHKRNRLRVDVPDNNYGAHYFLKSCGLEAMVLDSKTYRFVYRAPELVETTEGIAEISA